MGWRGVESAGARRIDAPIPCRHVDKHTHVSRCEELSRTRQGIALSSLHTLIIATACILVHCLTHVQIVERTGRVEE
jgi:hypothetical protein